MTQHFQRWPPLPRRPFPASGGPARVGRSSNAESTKTAALAFCDSAVPGLPLCVLKTAEYREDGSRLDDVTAQNLWRHPNTHPLVLFSKTLQLYGDDCLEWDPETLRLTLERDGHALSNAAWTKILAARTLALSPSPWRQWEVFHWVSQGLAGNSPNFHYLEEPVLGHQMVALSVMQMLDPGAETAEEVDKYIAATARNEALPWLPPPLDAVQTELEDPQIHCTNCGAVHPDDNDDTCVTCHARGTLEPVPYPFAELRDNTRRLYLERINRDTETMRGDLPETSAGYAADKLLQHGRYAQQRSADLARQYRRLVG